MSWKITSIIIKDAGDVTDEQILNKLFTATFEPLDPMHFEECINPSDDNTLYFGNYKNNLIISTYAFELVEKFYTKEISKAEEIFIRLFPKSEIGAFSLHGSMNYYAWAIISKGQKIRAKKGDADNGITCDFGEPLSEEQSFLKLSFKDKKGNTKYNWPRKNGETEVFTEDQIGGNYVSKIWSRFTGIELFDDELLNETQFRSYKLVPKTIEVDPPTVKSNIWQRLFGRKAFNTLKNEIIETTKFKYFDKADQFVKLRDKETKCNCCSKIKLCFDAEAFFDADDISSICPECLASGQLNDTDSSTCSGDIEELKKQIKDLKANLSENEINDLAEQKTNELEKTTPHLVTWQDWNWPCADGDYCKFIGYGSKFLYNQFTDNNKGKDIFINSLYKGYKESDTQYLWDEIMPDEEIKNYDDSSQYGTLFYVFKSLNSDKIVTTWDCD